MMKRAIPLLILFLCLASASTSRGENCRPSLPKVIKPQYPHASMAKFQTGSGAKGCIVFEPRSPMPDAAPVVYFLHGFLAVKPTHYIGWIEHLVKSGYIVLYPTYQSITAPAFKNYFPNAVKGIKDALELLKKDGHTKPIFGRFFVAGHSMGGLLAYRIICKAKAEGIPEPDVCFATQPGGLVLKDTPLPPKDALILTLWGEDDRTVWSRAAVRFFEITKEVSPKNTAVIKLFTDRHGSPTLSSAHLASCSRKKLDKFRPTGAGINAYDTEVIWKLFDRLIAQTYEENPDIKKSCIFDMPKWSDEMPAVSLLVRFGDGTIHPPAPSGLRNGKGYVVPNTEFADIEYFMPNTSGLFPLVVFPLLKDSTNLERTSARELLTALANRGIIGVLGVAKDELDENTWKEIDEKRRVFRTMSSIGASEEWAVVLNQRGFENLSAAGTLKKGPSCGILLSPGKPEGIPGGLADIPWLLLQSAKTIEKDKEAAAEWRKSGSKIWLHGIRSAGKKAILRNLGSKADDATATILFFIYRSLKPKKPFTEIPDPFLRQKNPR